MFYFYKNNIKIGSIKNDTNLELSITDSFDRSIILKYGDNSIVLLPNEDSGFISTLDTFGRFDISTLEDMVVVKYLYEKHRLLIYDDGYINNVSYLDIEKDEYLYDNALRSYILDCMCYYEIISSERELGWNFTNPYLLGVAHATTYRRMRNDLIKKRIKLFFLKLYRKIKFW